MLVLQSGAIGYHLLNIGIIPVTILLLERSPFEVLYSYVPKHFGLTVDDALPDSPRLSSWLADRALMQDLVRQHLLRAQECMKKQSDKRRSERSFQIGDWVFLKLQPYVQSSLARRSSQKLAF